MEKYSESINLSRFLPSTTDSSILDALYEDHPINSNKFEDFLNLPVNDEYKKKQEQKQIETTKEDITIEAKEN
jgi:hypothetical protein